MKNFAMMKLRAGESIAGIWSIIPCPMVCEIIASTGLDFIILDMEHGAFDLSTLSEAIRAVNGYECSPLVRVPTIDQALIQRVLDVGAHGIVAPQVKTTADAEKLVTCCRFAPDGIRGYNPYTRAGNFVSDHDSAYLVDGFPLLTVIIENMDAYSNLEGLVGVAGIDIFYLGVYDMSCAFGVRGQLNHPKVVQFVDDCFSRITAAGKVVGRMVDRVPKDSKDFHGLFYVIQPDTFQLKTSIQDRM